MSDITANVIVSMPSQLFTMARSFKAVANGSIYIGLVDTDPTIPSNQIQVYLENEDGSHVPVPQPLIINAGGYPVYNGQIAKFVTVQNHSMAVYDAYGTQQFYYPDILKYSPDQLRQELASASVPGASLVETADDGSVQDVVNNLHSGNFDLGYGQYTIKDRLDEEISIASIAGVDPTGANDSTIALQNFFNTLPDGSEVYVPPGTYKISGLTISNNSLKIRGAYQYAYGQSTTKFKAASASITLITFTGFGCKLEGILFEGYESDPVVNNFGAGTTCNMVNFAPSNAGGDIDSFVSNCIFWFCQTGIKGTGRNLTTTSCMFSFNRYGIDLYYKSGQQFRGHIIDNNRFHSCGGNLASSDSTLSGSVCIRLTVNSATGVLVDNYAGNINIRNNVSDGGCYQFFSGPLGRSSILSNNSIFRIGGVGSTVILIDNTPTAANTEYDGFTMSGNVIASDLPYQTSFVQQIPDYLLWIKGCKGGVINGNLISKPAKHAAVIDNSGDLIIMSNQIKNPNFGVTTNGVTFNAIEIINASNNIQIIGLNVRATAASPQYQYVVNNSGGTNITIDDVHANLYSAMYNESSTATTQGILNFSTIRRKEVYATNVSTLTTGNFKVGDICWLTAPAATGTSYIGAVCVTAGTGAAAVWRNFGALA
ncbi:phage tailspike protein [Enterobacter wuhouensis]